MLKAWPACLDPQKDIPPLTRLHSAKTQHQIHPSLIHWSITHSPYCRTLSRLTRGKKQQHEGKKYLNVAALCYTLNFRIITECKDFTSTTGGR